VTGEQTPAVRVAELRDAAWLRARYVDEGRSLAQIAAELGCAKQLVHYWLRTHGIPARTQTRFAGTPALTNPEWLRARYVTQRRTSAEIAADVGCPATTVKAALRVYGIPTRMGGPVPGTRRTAPGTERLDDREWLRARHLEEGLSCQQIAEALGCSAMTVHRALRQHGIGTRPPGNRRAAKGDVGTDDRRPSPGERS
jgi:transposase-like protein